MRSAIATLQELTIPMGAGLGAPSVYIGQRVPAELAAYYAPDMVVQAIVYRNPSGAYYWTAFVVPELGDPFVSTGVHAFALGDVPFTRETYRAVLGQGAGGNTGLLLGVTGAGSGSPGAGSAGGLTYLQVVDGARLDLLTGAHMTIDTGSDLTVEQGTIEVTAAGMLAIEAGSAYTIDGLSAPRAYLGASVASSGTAATSAGGEVAIGAYDIQPTLTWYDQRIYRIDAQVHVSGTVASTPYRVRVYHGANLLLAFDGETTADTTVRRSQSAVGWCYNNSGGPLTGVLSASIQRMAGAGNVSLYGDSLTPLSVTCSDATALGNSIGFAARTV